MEKEKRKIVNVKWEFNELKNSLVSLWLWCTIWLDISSSNSINGKEKRKFKSNCPFTD